MSTTPRNATRTCARHWAALLLLSLSFVLSGCAPFGGVPTATPSADLALLPVATKPASFTPTSCASQAIGEPYRYRSVAARAWAAEQVVLGTVTAQDARWEPQGGSIYIKTYSVLRIEERARGLPFDPLFLATSGGTVGSCTQAVDNLPQLPIGVRVLLFLSSSDPRIPITAQTIFSPNGDAASVVVIGVDDEATRLLAEVRAALRQPPPSDLPTDLVVPPERAPRVDP